MNKLNENDIDRIIEMAWEDRTPLDCIYGQFSINENELISIMRNNMKESSFRMWRKRVKGRPTKHSKNKLNDYSRFQCPTQNKQYKK